MSNSNGSYVQRGPETIGKMVGQMDQGMPPGDTQKELLGIGRYKNTIGQVMSGISLDLTMDLVVLHIILTLKNI